MQLDKAKTRDSGEFKINLNRIVERSSTLSEGYRNEYLNLDVECLVPHKNQARVIFDDEELEAMAQTIKELGVCQPLSVIEAEAEKGFFEVVSGERRLRAAKIAGLKKVPCILVKERKKAEEMAIIENIHRKDLHPLELMKAYQGLLKNNICKSQTEIAEKLSISRPSIVEILGLQVLSEDTTALLLKHNIKHRPLLRDLCKVDPAEQKRIIENFLDKKEISKQPTSRKVAFVKKANVVTIVLENDSINLLKNKIKHLSISQKQELKEVLGQLLNSL